MNKIKEQKKHIRKLMLKTRLALTFQEVESKSKLIIDLILKYIDLKPKQKIFLYLPIKKEVNTWPLIKACWQRDIQVFLPCCSKEPGKMTFYCLQKKEQVKVGKFDIPEPDPQVCTPFLKGSPNIIFIPGVAFDWNKYRLGYGGGYYDRLLEQINLSKTLLIGLAYHFQIVPTLPHEPWDKPVDMLITEKGIF